MGRSNFVGTKLINLKDRLPAIPKSPPQLDSEVKIEEKNQLIVQPEAPAPLPEPEHIGEIKLEAPPVEEKNEPKEEKSVKLEKHLLKALKAKKEDYFRTKSIVLKCADDAISQLLNQSKSVEEELERCNTTLSKIKETVSSVNSIDESKWNEHDFSIELSDAGKLVEQARIETIICKDKFKISDETADSLVKNNALSPVDFYSSTFSQLFKFGFKLFSPLILGVIISAIIIAIAILISMRVF